MTDSLSMEDSWPPVILFHKDLLQGNTSSVECKWACSCDAAGTTCRLVANDLNQHYRSRPHSLISGSTLFGALVQALQGVHWGVGNNAYLCLLKEAGNIVGKLQWQRVMHLGTSSAWLAEAQPIWATCSAGLGRAITPPVYQWQFQTV